MKVCTVSIVDKDGETHTLDVTAASLFDAVEQAVRKWYCLWWWNEHGVAEVRAGAQSWRVSLERVRQWRAAQGKRS